MAFGRKSKKILGITGIALGLVIGILVIVSLLFGESITQFVIKKVNENLKTEVSVKNARFSIFRRFPNAAVIFNDVVIAQSSDFKSADLTATSLLECKNIYVEINLIKLLFKNYSISRIVAENGEINLVVNKEGQQNFDVFKKSGEQGGKTSVNLYGIQLKNFKYKYIDKKQNLDFQGFAERINIKGNITNNAFNFEIAFDIHSRHLLVRNIEYLQNRKVASSFKLKKQGEIYRIETTELDVEGIHLDFKMVFTTGENSEMDMLTKASDVSLAGFQRLVPDEYQKYIRDFESKGKTSLQLSVKGKTDGNNFPHVEMNFAIKNGSVRQTKNNIKLTDVNLDGIYTNGALNSSTTSAFRITNFSSHLEKGRISGNFAYTNFTSPDVHIDLQTFIDLGNIRKFLSVDTIENLDGNLTAEIELNAGFKDASGFKRENIRSFKVSGKADLSNARLQLKNSNYLYNEINSRIILGNDFQFENLSLKIDDNDFYIKGTLYDAVPYLLRQNNTLNLKAEMRSQKLDLSKYFEKDPKKTSSDKYDSRILFPLHLTAELNVNISNFRLKRFNATNAIARVNYKPGMYTLNSAVFETMQGKVSGNGAVLLDYNKNLIVKGQTSLKKIDIKQMFYVFENFGQNILRDNHLKGSLTGDILVSCEWDNRMNLKKNSVLVESNIEIANGELINFEPLMGLSKFISLSELKDIKFSNLKNQIFIRHQQIIIPQMDINSSAFNITGSGVHDFDNHYTYRINVLLSEVLARKAKLNKKENSEFGIIEDDGLGKTKIPLLIVGFNDVYKISYDTKGLKVIIKESMQVQKKELRSIFKEEFGLFKKDSTVKSTKKTNTKFQVDWEEKTAPEKIPEKTPAIKKRKTFEEEEGFQIEFDE
jgi:hypothetical protein